jgi:hypothetical protein
VDMPAATLGKPGADEFGLMAHRIVHNDVDVEIGRKVPLDSSRNLGNSRALARHALSDDRSSFHTESSDYPRFGIRVLIEG